MMKKLQHKFHDFLCDKTGATAIEYGLIAALIAIAMITGVQALAGSSGSLWDSHSSKVSDAMDKY